MAETSIDEGAGRSGAAAELGRRLAGKYMTFQLAREEYGLEILKVREIIGYMQITAVPQTPHHVKGVINLRGQVIPVIDLRLKFGMDPAEVTEETCIIVVEINQDDATWENLQGRLTDIFKTRAEKVMFVKGDDNIPFADVANVIDIAHSAGVDKVGLITAKIEAGG